MYFSRNAGLDGAWKVLEIYLYPWGGVLFNLLETYIIKYKQLTPIFCCPLLAIRLCSNRYNTSLYHTVQSPTSRVSIHRQTLVKTFCIALINSIVLKIIFLAFLSKSNLQTSFTCLLLFFLNIDLASDSFMYWLNTHTVMIQVFAIEQNS